MADTKSFYGGSAVPKELTFTSLSYPTDINDNDFYPDCVCFTIQKRTGVSIDNVTKSASAGIAEFKRGWNAPEGVPPELAKIMKDEQRKNKGNPAAAQKKAMSAVMKKWNEGTTPDGEERAPLPENMFELNDLNIAYFHYKIFSL